MLEREITIDDIGKQVKLRNGDIKIITDVNSNSYYPSYPVHVDGYNTVYVYTTRGKFYCGAETELDIVKIIEPEEKEPERKIKSITITITFEDSK